MSFEDNRVAVKNALHDAGVAFLHEAAGELEAQTKRNIPHKGQWFNQQKNNKQQRQYKKQLLLHSKKHQQK